MKISQKILLLVNFLLMGLCINSFVGLSQLNKVGYELREVANKDLVLSEISASINQYKLKKAILFERIINAAEETAFEELSGARKKYLIDHIEHTKSGFDQISKDSALNIIKARNLINDAIDNSLRRDIKKEYTKGKIVLEKIEQSHISYDAFIQELYELLKNGDYQLSLDDLDNIQFKERDLTNQLDSLVMQIKTIIQNSLDEAEKAERLAKAILINSSILIAIVSIAIAFIIIISISRPLKELMSATKNVGQGNFDIQLRNQSRDEIGEVSNSFMVMAQQLSVLQNPLEEKNRDLAKNLELSNQQKRDLEKVNKELDSFVYTVSHDIGAPLRGIAWYGQSLRDYHLDSLDQKGKDAVGGICNSADQLNIMIKELLHLTQISRVRNPFEASDMNNVLTAVMKRLDFNIKKYHVDLIIPENIPQIICDRIKLSEVFLNLINNAIKFSSKNKDVKPKVEVGFKEIKEHYQFSVKDNGIGIDPKYHTQVFEIFRRLNKSDDYHGTGAGLAIVKSIIDDHGGQIWIESKENEGATFIFTIPKTLPSIT